MSGVVRIADGLDRTVSVLERAARAMVLAAVVVALVCFSVLVVAGTYGILHHGDDFNFVNGSSGGGGGDIIHVPGGLP